MPEPAQDPFDATIALIAEAASVFQDPWWIIGSAAARLAGAKVGRVPDIDLLVSVADAERLFARWSAFAVSKLPSSPRFRSTIFARFEHTPTPVEVMAAFEMIPAGGEEWTRVDPLTRIPVNCVFIPSPLEQIEILQRMGRPKDGPRIAALKALRR